MTMAAPARADDTVKLLPEDAPAPHPRPANRRPMSDKRTSFVARNRWLLWTLAIGVAVVFLASFMTRSNPVLVRAATAERTTIRSVVSTNGKVEPVENFEAHTPIATTVRKLYVKEGDGVKKGQLLAELDDASALSDALSAMARVRAADADLSAIKAGGIREEVLTLQSQMTKAKTERDAAQKNLDAMKALEQQGAASPAEVASAQTRLDRANADVTLIEQKQKGRYSSPEIGRVEAQKQDAQAAYDAAEDTLAKLNIRAPFDGTVYSLPVLQGAYINAGDLVLEVADLSKVRVRAFVDEPDIGRLAPGNKVEITWDALRNRTWESVVTEVPTVIKQHGARNVGEVVCIVDNGDMKLLPNVNVGVTIVTGEHQNVLAVPREAIHLADGQTFVYEIVNDELRRRNVKTAISNLTSVEITSGLEEHAEVALAPVNGKPLREGLAVRVVE
jgi:HlyD family secretion protein